MLTKNDLDSFTGTECYYQHNLARKVLYTEGVQFLAQQGHAYWLLDKIATMQIDEKIRSHEFQVWSLEVTGTTATLNCKNDDSILHSEHIAFTDFPLDEITLWVEGNVILLPSEH